MTITIEDDGEGVKVVADPSFGKMMQTLTERSPSPAESYAMSALNKMREMSKAAEKLPYHKKPTLVKNED